MKIQNLLAQNLSSCKLKILVFGPSPNTTTSNDAVKAILKKRLDIKERLCSLGHIAEFPEDLVNLTGNMPCQNSFFQEILLIKDCDMVIVLVESPGSNTELGLIASRTEYARKSQCFIRKEYSAGLGHAACETVKELGGDFHPFTYPDDIQICNLLTNVERRVQTVQLAKFLS